MINPLLQKQTQLCFGQNFLKCDELLTMMMMMWKLGLWEQMLETTFKEEGFPPSELQFAVAVFKGCKL